MPLLSTDRGHVDEERVKTIVTRLLESIGKNEKSIWERYNEMAAVDDNIREVEWRDLADTILVFDGLFAAFLSAFLVFMIPQLQASSNDVALDVLIHISQQLGNSSTPAYVPTAFQVPPNTAVVNLLFFLTLALVLIDAFFAMLVKSWLQEFDRGWRKYTVANLRAQERERRLQGLERWKLPGLVKLLPILIQAALLLFCVGLLVLLFPLHLPSAILLSFALATGLTFYGFTTFVSVFDEYAPFSSLVPHGLTTLPNTLKTTGVAWLLRISHGWHIVSGTSSHNSRPVTPQSHHVVQALFTASPEVLYEGLRENRGVAQPARPQGHMVIEKKEVVTSRYQISPQTRVDILERLIVTTAEAVENVPIFLELLDQPVKDPTLRPSNIEKWEILLHITLRLLGDPSTFSDSVARTIARTMLFCCNPKTVDQQLCQRLEHRLGGRGSDEKGPREPLNSLLSSYLHFWLDKSSLFYWRKMCQTIAFLEPSDAADAELLWMVNTIHRVMKQSTDTGFATTGWGYNIITLSFFTAVLTYISSTEQSRRSQVPLTAAVIYAMHTINPALEPLPPIHGLYVLPGTVSTSASVPLTFHQVDGIDALDLWNDACVQLARDLLQDYPQIGLLRRAKEFQLPLIAALYIDSTKQGHHAHSIFAVLVRCPNITNITLDTWQWSEAYDHGKLAIYWYMALSQKPLHQSDYPLRALETVIENTITSPQLSCLYLLDIAVRHVHETAPSSSKWLTRRLLGLEMSIPGTVGHTYWSLPDHWILLHLDTLFVQSSFLLSAECEVLKWTGTPEELHIAKARLALYDSLAEGENKGAHQLEPDPQLLQVFLMSKNFAVCTGALKWCLNLVPTSQSSTTGDADSTGIFIPDKMGYKWIEHLFQVLCGDSTDGLSWVFLAKHLVPKWAILPPSWCSGFASAFLSPPLGGNLEVSAYQFLAAGLIDWLGSSHIAELQAFLSFLTTLLELIKPTLTSHQLASIESWLVRLPAAVKDDHAQIEVILATRRQQLEAEALGFFAELPMADSGIDG